MLFKRKEIKHSQHGYSLTEVLFAVGIVGIGGLGVSKVAKQLSKLNEKTQIEESLDTLEARLISAFGNRFYAKRTIERSRNNNLRRCLMRSATCSYSENYKMDFFIRDNKSKGESIKLSGAGEREGFSLKGPKCRSLRPQERKTACHFYFTVATYLGWSCGLNYGAAEKCAGIDRSGFRVEYKIFLHRKGSSTKKMVRSGVVFTTSREGEQVVRKGTIECDPGDLAKGWGNFSGKVCSPRSEWVYEDQDTLGPGSAYSWDLTQCEDDEFVAGIDADNKVVCKNLTELN